MPSARFIASSAGLGALFDADGSLCRSCFGIMPLYQTSASRFWPHTYLLGIVALGLLLCSHISSSMAAPIYSQAEADAMIAMPKRIAFDAWNDRGEGRTTTGEFSCEIKAGPEDATLQSRYEFEIEIRRNSDLPSYSITLCGRMDNRPKQALCRYDVQAFQHDNTPSLCPPPDSIDPGIFHRHTYNESSCQYLDRWDGCAEPLDIPQDGDFHKQLARLRSQFLIDMSIKFSDANTAQNYLYEGGA